MKTHWTAVLLAALMLALCDRAAAQTSAVTDSALESPNRFELGAGIGGFLAFDGSAGVGFLTAQARTNLTPRIAVNLIASFDPSRSSVNGLYELSVNQRLRQRGRSAEPFLLCGVAGSFAYYKVDGYQYTTSTGDTIVRHSYTHGQVSPPTAFVGGGGYRYRITNHIFFEVAAQALVPLGFFVAIPQAHASVMVPIGK